MSYGAATADKIRSGCGISFSDPIAWVIVALTSAVGAWAIYPVTCVSDSASSTDFDTSSFDDRFISGAASKFHSMDFSRPLVQSLTSELEIKFQQAKDRLAQK